MVKIRIWRPSLPLNIGHASLEIGRMGDANYRYISVWPDGATPFKGRSFTYADDVLNEGDKPAYTQTYDNLREQDMIAYWDTYKGNSWNFLFFNCMSNVAVQLSVGVYGLTDHDGLHHFTAVAVNNHAALLAYAWRLKSQGY